MTVRRWMSGLAAAVLAAATVAGAQQASFTVTQQGKPVGTASCTFAQSAQGIESSALVQVKLQGLDYALSKTETLTAGRELTHATVSATVNQQAVHVTAKPDAAQLLVNVSANGRATTTRVEAHAHTVLLADFDPGALETLLALAAAHNNRDLWVVIPKGTIAAVPVTLATYADERGTLDGKPVTVRHLVATMGPMRTDLFAGPANELLQAELPQQGFALVRKGFVLTPPAKPAVPVQ